MFLTHTAQQCYTWLDDCNWPYKEKHNTIILQNQSDIFENGNHMIGKCYNTASQWWPFQSYKIKLLVNIGQPVDHSTEVTFNEI